MKASTGVFLVAALLLSVFASPAHATKITRKNVSFEDLVGRAEVIVLARRAAPESVQEEIAVVPESGAKPGVEYRPYVRVRTRWTVLESLKGLPVEGTLEVDGAGWKSKMDMHRQRLEGLRASYTFVAYGAVAGVANEQTVVLFLNGTPETGFQLALDDSIEVASRADEVRRLVGASKKAPKPSKPAGAKK